ncbi:MAG: hypothetical protein KAG97_04745 [Victivallales bacterium]|nr:hypothetical protein [Victivallales bacterium]
MKTISAKISDSDYQVLGKLAKSPPGSKSAIVRDAVHEFCKKQVAGIEKRNAILRRTKGAFRHAPLDAEKHREELSKRMI